MKAKTLRVSLLIFIMSIIGAFFQNCSPPVNFTATDPALLSSSGAISGQPQLPCSDGQPDGTVRWDVVVGQTEAIKDTSCPGNLMNVFEKLQKFVCTNGQYASTNEFKNGSQLPSTGGCDCAGGLANGMSSESLKTPFSDTQDCSAGTGTVTSNYLDYTITKCNNGISETSPKRDLVDQKSTCTCPDGLAAEESILKIESSVTDEPKFCENGGDAKISYNLKRKYNCTAELKLVPELDLIKTDETEKGSCWKTVPLAIAEIKTTKALDMIWVIDNSGSMSEEAAQVRNNLEKFVTSLNVSSDSNMKFLLVSKTSTVTQSPAYCIQFPTKKGCLEQGVSLPANIKSNFSQEDIYVDSTNGPSLLIRKLQQLDSASTPFFRRDSKKVVVFVTDDNSTSDFIDKSVNPNITVSAFSAIKFSAALNSLTNVSPGEASFFGFIGLGNDPNKDPYSSCQAATGLVYKTLSAKNNGAVFNICDTDWASNFDALKTNVQTTLERTYNLKAQNVANVVKIVVDNNTILADPANFTFDPATGILTLTDKVIFTATSKITVYYN
jgi:hypothetical protein